MKTKKANLIGFLCAVIVIGLSLYVAGWGIGDIMPGVFDDGGVRKGLDLVGGSMIVYEADIEGTPDTLADDMKAVESMMRSRLDNLGYTEGSVTLSGDKRVTVEIPAITNPEEAVQKLGTTAKLEFLDYEGNVVLDGSDIKSADALYGDPTGEGYAQHYVRLVLKDESVSKFSEATKNAAALISTGNNYIKIALDGEEISKPSVTKQLSQSEVVISGNFDQDRAVWLAGVIHSGQLPFALKEVQLESVGATLGERALETSMIAGGIGILLVMLFMIVMYRLPGVVATVALCAYMAMTGIIIVLFKINLSLPGIAGVVLAIGMAVDANVVIFERVKEELRLGKSTNAAVNSGFKSAFTAVLDSNITTLIAAGVLWYFGSGPVRGFAITLFIGVVLSMISAVVITRFLLNRVVGMRVTNVWLYGVKEA